MFAAGIGSDLKENSRDDI